MIILQLLFLEILIHFRCMRGILRLRGGNKLPKSKKCENEFCNNLLKTETEILIGWCEDCLDAQEKRDEDWV